MTLTEFLNARLDEFEGAAKRRHELADRVGAAFGSPEPPEDDISLGDLAYFAMHADAARALIDVEAKRAIVTRMSRRAYHQDSVGDLALTVLRDLAVVYADHPDYDRAWRP